MAISNINSGQPTTSVSSVASPKTISTTDNAKASAEKFAATIVTLSAQARKLSLSGDTKAPTQTQAQTRTTQTQNSGRSDESAAAQNQTRTRDNIDTVLAQTKEAAKETPPARSRINTYA